MTDYSRDRLGPQDEDRLPWLEPVEEEYDEGGVGTGRLIVWLVAALMLLALVVGGYFWLRGNDKATSGEGALIKAPDSYYKERPGETAAPIGEYEIERERYALKAIRGDFGQPADPADAMQAVHA